jgi:hypothetical protein
MPRTLNLGIAADGSFDLRWEGGAEQAATARAGASSTGPLAMPPGVPFVEPGRPAEA